jgi:uncharacterized protein (DUF433 family)
VESVPGKVSGAWVLKGTRMPVSAIFENLEAGANIDDIMEWFDGLDREQVKAVIEFAAGCVPRQCPQLSGMAHLGTDDSRDSRAMPQAIWRCVSGLQADAQDL